MTPPWLTQEVRRAAIQPQVYVQDELCVAFLQFFGAFACSRIGLEHIELADFQRIESAMLHELDLAFFEDRFEGAPRTEQLVLEAMARETGPVTLRRLRPLLRDVASVDLLVRRLVERGLVYRTGRATYDFALPLFRSFIRRRRQLTRLTGSVSGAPAERGAAHAAPASRRDTRR